jgi:hypothetical protein
MPLVVEGKTLHSEIRGRPVLSRGIPHLRPGTWRTCCSSRECTDGLRGRMLAIPAKHAGMTQNYPAPCRTISLSGSPSSRLLPCGFGWGRPRCLRGKEGNRHGTPMSD